MKYDDKEIHLRTRLFQHHPSAFLLAAQLVLLILYAVIDKSRTGQELVSAFGILVLILVVWVVIRSPSINWIAWVLAIPAFILTLLYVLLEYPFLHALSSLTEGVLYFYAAGSMIAYMLADRKVTPDELFAVGSTFTLLAWGFAHFYLVCYTWIPDSFLYTTNPGQSITFVEFLSLSFTNLSATGLGDILPIAPASRVLVMLEQFCGIGYLAMVVSRLIGLATSSTKSRSS